MVQVASVRINFEKGVLYFLVTDDPTSLPLTFNNFLKVHVVWSHMGRYRIVQRMFEDFLSKCFQNPEVLLSPSGLSLSKSSTIESFPLLFFFSMFKHQQDVAVPLKNRITDLYADLRESTSYT